jgi:hypothetical protein
MSNAASEANAASKPPMRFRRTRLAVSVFFGALTVALCLLWVRSYWYRDAIYGPQAGPHKLGLSTSWGRVRFATFDRTYENMFTGVNVEGWGLSCTPIEQPFSMQQLQLVNTPLSSFGFGFAGSSDHYGVVAVFPIWAPAIIASAFATVPWAKFSPRFSIRALLMATTLVAVLLGLVTWVSR